MAYFCPEVTLASNLVQVVLWGLPLFLQISSRLIDHAACTVTVVIMQLDAFNLVVCERFTVVEDVLFKQSVKLLNKMLVS